MNIWILNHYALPPFLPGGTRHYDFARQLTLRGHKVTVFASSFQHVTFEDINVTGDSDYKYVNYDGVDWCWIKTFPYKSNGWQRIVNMLSYYRKLLKVARKAENGKPDLIIGSTVHPFTPLAAIKLKNKFKVPYVFEIRDLWPQTMIDMKVWKKEDFISKFFKKIEKKSVKHAKSIIALSPLTKDYIQTEYGQGGKVNYIPNTIDLDSFDSRFKDENIASKGHDTLIQLREIAKDKFLLMFTGSIIISNKMEFIIDTAQKLKDHGNTEVYIAIVGNGQERKRLEKVLIDKQLDNIKFYDPVPKDMVPHLLNITDALLLIQGDVMWGSMNKLFDYMAAKKPIVSAISANHNNPLLEIDESLCVKDFNSDQLKDILIDLTKRSKEDLEKISAKFRHKVEKEHDIKDLALKLESILNNCIG